VPDGFHVRAADGMLWYSGESGRFPGQLNNYTPGASGTFVRENFEAHAEQASQAQSAANVARQALDELQDHVDEATHDPWPGTVRPPWPFAEVRGETLHLWYGGPAADDEPVLVCADPAGQPASLAGKRFTGRQDQEHRRSVRCGSDRSDFGEPLDCEQVGPGRVPADGGFPCGPRLRGDVVSVVVEIGGVVG
jgi:hypothetical protein